MNLYQILLNSAGYGLLGLLAFAAGGLWRRWLGGWDPGGWKAPFGRTLKWAVFALLCWPFYIIAPWWFAIVLTILLQVWLNVQHNNGGYGWRPLWRFGLAGLGYVIARKLSEKGKLPAFPPLIHPDGWTEWGEIWLGGVTMSIVTVVCVLFQEALSSYIASVLAWSIAYLW